MHPAKALPLLEVADRVQVVSGGAVQQRPPLVSAGGAGVREQAVQGVDTGIDEQRVRPLERGQRLRQAERVVDAKLGGCEGVAAARGRVDHVPAAQCMADVAQRHLLGAEITDLLEHRGPCREQPAVASHLHLDADPAALDQLPVAGPPAQVGRLRGQAHPEPRDQRCREQADRNRVHRTGAEAPGRDVERECEQQRAGPAAGHVGPTATPGPGCGPPPRRSPRPHRPRRCGRRPRG